MRYLDQKPQPNWWKETEGYQAYRLREYSGVLVSVWAIFFIFSFVTHPPLIFLYILHAAGLIGAAIHTSTWLSLMPKLTPFALNEEQQKTGYAVLAAIWIILSAILLIFLWP